MLVGLNFGSVYFQLTVNSQKNVKMSIYSWLSIAKNVKVAIYSQLVIAKNVKVTINSQLSIAKKTLKWLLTVSCK